MYKTNETRYQFSKGRHMFCFSKSQEKTIIEMIIGSEPREIGICDDRDI
jgi:hypothetical protein